MTAARRISWLTMRVCAAAFFIAACSTISTYDQVAYEHATNLKVDTLALMDKATESYAAHTKDVAGLNLELDKAYEYDKGRPLNRVTVQMWDVLRGPNGILARFLSKWKNRDTLNSVVIADTKEHVGREFDDIIQLESGKIKKTASQ
jgi:hypothetical protein